MFVTLIKFNIESNRVQKFEMYLAHWYSSFEDLQNTPQFGSNTIKTTWAKSLQSSFWKQLRTICSIQKSFQNLMQRLEQSYKNKDLV
jgi:hypothetical protein